MMKHFPALILFFLLIPTPSWAETYEKWVEECHSYKDVAQWLNGNFRLDQIRDGQSRTPRNTGEKPPRVQAPEETFRHRTGSSLDAALFARKTLNRINPDYRARIIHIAPDRTHVHYLCGFYLGGRLFVMDYWNSQEKLIGTHGPFENLKDYVERFYLKHQSRHQSLFSCSFGFPPSRFPKSP
jgi:hypothetical protein